MRQKEKSCTTVVNVGMYARAETNVFQPAIWEEFGLNVAGDLSRNTTHHFANTVAHVKFKK